MTKRSARAHDTRRREKKSAREGKTGTPTITGRPKKEGTPVFPYRAPKRPPPSAGALDLAFKLALARPPSTSRALLPLIAPTPSSSLTLGIAVSTNVFPQQGR